MSEKISVLSDLHLHSVVARKYGVSAALVLNRIAWSLKMHSESPNDYKRYFINDRWWMCNTYDALVEAFNGVLSKSTINRAILDLEQDDILISFKKNAKHSDHQKWYSIDLARYGKLTGQNDTIRSCQNDTIRSCQNDTIDDVKLTRSDHVKLTCSSSTESHKESHTMYDHVKMTRSDEHNMAGKPAAHSSGDTSLNSLKWEDNDRFAKVFTNICQIPICKRRFARERVRRWLEEIIEAEHKTLEDIERITSEWAGYYSTPGAYVKNPLASLGNWIRRDFGKKGETGYGNSKTTGRPQCAPEDAELIANILKNSHLGPTDIGDGG